MVSLSANTKKEVQHLLISAEEAGQRLDNFLIRYLKNCPKTRIYQMVRKGEVRVNKHRVKPQYRLLAADDLRLPPIYESPRPIKGLLSRAADLAESITAEILYEDHDLLVLNKPAGVAVHGGSGISWGVIEALRHLRGATVYLELAHRLDRDTSGCLLIAKRRSVLNILHEAFRRGQVRKSYLALVQGPWRGHAQVTEPLERYLLASGERRVRVSPEGKASCTEFRVLKHYPGFKHHAIPNHTAGFRNDSGPQHAVGLKHEPALSLVLAKPRTGRTHQIRVHTAFVGNPIAGDIKYGNRLLNAALQDRGFSRLFLHAQAIGFRLSAEAALMQIEAPCDREWAACLAYLGDRSDE